MRTYVQAKLRTIFSLGLYSYYEVKKLLREMSPYLFKMLGRRAIHGISRLERRRVNVRGRCRQTNSTSGGEAVADRRCVNIVTAADGREPRVAKRRFCIEFCSAVQTVAFPYRKANLLFLHCRCNRSLEVFFAYGPRLAFTFVDYE